MSIKVVVPQIGQSIAEATIVKWFRKPGERIEKGETLVEIGTDKINTEIPAPADGIVESLLFAEGETVAVLTEIAVLSGEESSQEPMPPASAPVRPTPLVRRLAEEHGIDLSSVRGTGEGGRITREDVLAAAATKTAGKAAPGADVERIPMTRMRKLIAEHMMQSKMTAADLTTVFEVDMTEVVRERQKAKSAFESRHGAKLTYLPFVIAAAAKALRAFPVLNSSVEKDEIIYRKQIHIGIAIAIENGLIVPVIRNADQKTVLEITLAAHDLAQRARENRLKADDLEGGTFTITNPGVFGALMGTPIISQPQVAILGVGAVQKRAVVIDDALAIRTMAYLSLTYDHRALDGSDADQFLAHIKKTLELQCPPAEP